MNTATAQLYETDFYGWAQNQAGVLRAGRFANLDLNNLIEEIEDMGKSRQRELESRLEILLMHLLKWRFQSDFKGSSWRATIRVQRSRIAKLLRENPSLKSRISTVFEEAYKLAVELAEAETNLPNDTFPAECPWTYAQVTDPDFWPEPA